MEVCQKKGKTLTDIYSTNIYEACYVPGLGLAIVDSVQKTKDHAWFLLPQSSSFQEKYKRTALADTAKEGQGEP